MYTIYCYEALLTKIYYLVVYKPVGTFRFLDLFVLDDKNLLRILKRYESPLISPPPSTNVNILSVKKHYLHANNCCWFIQYHSGFFFLLYPNQAKQLENVLTQIIWKCCCGILLIDTITMEVYITILSVFSLWGMASEMKIYVSCWNISLFVVLIYW